LDEVGVENLTWVIVAIGAFVGGPIMMFGYRKAGLEAVGVWLDPRRPEG
jgi:hypothetical protein